MAHAQTHPAYRFSPEDGIRKINEERKHRSMIAIGVFALAALALGASAYFSYRGVPAPADPGNAHMHLVEPYQ